MPSYPHTLVQCVKRLKKIEKDVIVCDRFSMLDELHGIWARTERSPLTEMTPYAPGMQLQLQCFSPEHVRGLNEARKRCKGID